MEFSQKLRQLIEECGQTQKQVAANLSMAASTMGGYVQGSSEPDFDTLLRLANYFGVTTDYLLGHHTLERVKDEAEVLRVYRALLPEQRIIYIDQGKAFLRANSSQNKE